MLASSLIRVTHVDWGIINFHKLFTSFRNLNTPNNQILAENKMGRELNLRRRLLELTIPVFVFVIIGVFTYQVFFQIPYAGFEFANGRVSLIITKSPNSDSLRIGDRLIEVGDMDFEDFRNNLRARLISNTSVDQVVPLVVERNGQTLSIDWIIPGPTPEQLIERINSQWWISYVFWFAGTASLLFIRPKDTRWLLFVAFSYLTAIWLGAGSGPSHWHLGQSAVVLRSAIWLSVPVYLHFHWLFPRNLVNLPTIVWVVLYLGAGTLAILEWFQLPATSSYYWGGLIALGGSILLLFVHYISQREGRRDIYLLLMSSFLTLLPIIAIITSILLESEPSMFVGGGAFLALPALPGAYFFAMFRQQYEELAPRTSGLVRLYIVAVFLGVLFITVFSILDARFDLEQSTLTLGLASIILAGIVSVLTFFPFLILPALAEASATTASKGEFNLRANRLVSLYLFLTLIITIFAGIIFIFDNLFEFPGKATVLGVFAGLSIGIISALGFRSFQRLSDHRLLGIPLPPTALLETYTSKIATSLDIHNLVQLLRDEILPSLLVRQSALLKVSENNPIDVLYATRVSPDQLPSGEFIRHLWEQNHPLQGNLDSGDLPSSCSWARVVFPLVVEGRLLGMWLLGSRDPDDIYGQTEIEVLEAIANQTAIALVNIDQADRLHAFLQADIERQDEERMRLARGLHDVVLNQLASLSLHSEGQGSRVETHNHLQTVIDYLREVISNLRPTMLVFGLYHGLAELVDQLNDRGLDGMMAQLEIAPTNVRYDEKIEQNLFWIIQQACENAINHSKGTTVTISGAIESQHTHLVVEDDGTGFFFEGGLNIPELLLAKHYGLVGMYERADLIGAQLFIDSKPGIGTTVSVELTISTIRSS